MSAFAKPLYLKLCVKPGMAALTGQLHRRVNAKKKGG